MSFEDDLNADIDPDWAEASVLLNGNVHRLRFTRMDGMTWAEQCDKAPGRDGVEFDDSFHYDIRKLTLLAAPLSGVLMDDDKPVTLTPEQWDSVFARIDGNAFKRISDVLFGLNEIGPLEALKAAKKELAASAATSKSSSNSESPRAASTGGSRKKKPGTSTTQTVA